MTILHEVNVVIMLNMILQKIPPDVISLDKKIPRCHSLTRIQSPMMSLLHYLTLHSRFSVPVPNSTHTRLYNAAASSPSRPREGDAIKWTPPEVPKFSSQGCVPLGWSDPDQWSKICLDHGASKEPALVTDSPVPLMHHNPDRSWITDPDPEERQLNINLHLC